MKVFFTTSIIFFTVLISMAQAPDQISYQAVVRNSSGELVSDQTISVEIKVLQGSADGTAVYTETHSVSTNSNGLLTLMIGDGSVSVGTLSAVDWSASNYFIQTSVDLDGGNDFTVLGTSQLLSVPYALHAKTAETISGDIEYEETDPTFSSSVAANISEEDIEKWNEETQLSEEEVDDFVSNNGYLTEEVDGSVTNEIQDLSLTENTLKITGNDSATSIDLSRYLDDTDTKLTEAEVDEFVANNGYLTAEGITNEIQDLALGENILTITGNESATSIDLSTYLDNTDDQTLSLEGTTLSITDGNSVDLSSAVSSSYSIGDQLDGGIVFYVDETGQHGLICAIEDQASAIPWSFASGITGGQFFGVGGGYMNTMLIVASQLGDYPYSNASSSYAAYFCAFYYTTVDGTQIGGWYLPNLQEIRLMANAKDEIDAAAVAIGGTALSTDPYWTSQEGGIDTNSYAQAFDMSYTQYGKAKTETLAVRAIKTF